MLRNTVKMMIKKKLTKMLGDFDESKKERFKEIFDTAVDKKAAALVDEHVTQTIEQKLGGMIQDHIEQAIKKKLKAELRKLSRKMLLHTLAVGAVCVCGCVAITNLNTKSKKK